MTETSAFWPFAGEGTSFPAISTLAPVAIRASMDFRASFSRRALSTTH